MVHISTAFHLMPTRNEVEVFAATTTNMVPTVDIDLGNYPTNIYCALRITLITSVSYQNWWHRFSFTLGSMCRHRHADYCKHNCDPGFHCYSLALLSLTPFAATTFSAVARYG